MPVNLNYQTYGEGHPLYLLHGLFGSNRNWLSVARQLGTTEKIIAIDLRNHGESGHSDSMSYTDMADDIAALAHSLGHEKINLLGHSMGGKTGMATALKYPELFNKLIIADIAPIDYNPKHDRYVTAMQRLPVRELTNRTEASDFLAKDIQDVNLRQFLLQNLVKDPEAGYRWRINLDGILRNYEKLRSFPPELTGVQFRKPALFLAGERSDFVLPEHHDSITRYFPEAKIVTVDGAGHWLHADKPEEVTAEIRKFLTSSS